MNQCDGCRRGLPIKLGGMHYNPSGYFMWDVMMCTAYKYADRVITRETLDRIESLLTEVARDGGQKILLRTKATGLMDELRNSRALTQD